MSVGAKLKLKALGSLILSALLGLTAYFFSLPDALVFILGCTSAFFFCLSFVLTLSLVEYETGWKLP